MEWRILVKEGEGDRGPGSPLADCPVRCQFDSQPFTGRDSPYRVELDGVTDGDGICRFELSPTVTVGEYALFARLGDGWRFVDAGAFSGERDDDDPSRNHVRWDAEIVRKAEFGIGVLLLDEETGEPIEGATVTRVVHQDGSPSSFSESLTTEVDGRAWFGGVGKGDWDGWVDLSCAGYVPSREPAGKSPVREPKYYRYSLTKGHELHVKVLDLTGKPVEGALLELHHFEPRFKGPTEKFWRWWYVSGPDGTITVRTDPGSRVRIEARKVGFDLTEKYLEIGTTECIVPMRPGNPSHLWDPDGPAGE